MTARADIADSAKRIGFAVVAILLALGLVALSRITRDWLEVVDEPESVSVGDKAYVPADQRTKGMDAVVAENLRVTAVCGVDEVEVGSVEIGKKKLGYLRIGALNEAVFRDVRLVVGPSFFSMASNADVHVVQSGMGPEADAGGRRQGGGGGATPEAAADPALLARRPGLVPTPPEMRVQGSLSFQDLHDLFDRLMALSPYQGQTVSCMAVERFAIALKRNGVPNVTLVESRALQSRSRDARVLTLKGDVVFRSAAGRKTLRCDTAAIRLDRDLMVTIPSAVVEDEGGSVTLARLSFPLPVLVNEGGGVWEWSPGPGPHKGGREAGSAR